MHLKEFQPRDIDLTSVIFCVGKRMSGKSKLIESWCYELHKHGGKDGKKIDMVVVFSETAGVQRGFDKFVPNSLIHTGYDEAKITALMDQQKALIEKRGHTQNIMLILDDCAFKKGIFNSETFQRLIFNSRHLKILLVVSVQYAMTAGPSIRNNVDIVVCMRDPLVSSQKKLYQNFFGHFGSFKSFQSAFLGATKNYSALIAVNNDTSHQDADDLTSLIFWFRADLDSIPSHWKMGREIYWHYDVKYRQNKQQIERQTDSLVLKRKPQQQSSVRRDASLISMPELRPEMMGPPPVPKQDNQKKRADTMSIVL